jgi:hypothetical protein
MGPSLTGISIIDFPVTGNFLLVEDTLFEKHAPDIQLSSHKRGYSRAAQAVNPQMIEDDRRALSRATTHCC